MNNDFIIQCEEIYLDDMKRMKQDNLLAKEIIKNDILDAKKNELKYLEFKKKYRPVGDDSSMRKIWENTISCDYDDWVILFNE